jgi:hypothetical protein
MISRTGGITVEVLAGVEVRKGTAGGRSVATTILPAQALNINKRKTLAMLLGMWRLYTFHLPTPSACAKLS